MSAAHLYAGQGLPELGEGLHAAFLSGAATPVWIAPPRSSQEHVDAVREFNRTDKMYWGVGRQKGRNDICVVFKDEGQTTFYVPLEELFILFCGEVPRFK